MMGDIIVAALAILLYVDAWWTIIKNTKDINDLSTRYFILKDKTRDLENRIRFLETRRKKEKVLQSLSKNPYDRIIFYEEEK